MDQAGTTLAPEQRLPPAPRSSGVPGFAPQGDFPARPHRTDACNGSLETGALKLQLRLAPFQHAFAALCPGPPAERSGQKHRRPRKPKPSVRAAPPLSRGCAARFNSASCSGKHKFRTRRTVGRSCGLAVPRAGCGGRMVRIEVSARGSLPRYRPPSTAVILFDTSRAAIRCCDEHCCFGLPAPAPRRRTFVCAPHHLALQRSHTAFRA